MMHSTRRAEIEQLLSSSQYRVIDSLGQGRMAEVLLVEERLLKKKFALKLIHTQLAEDKDYINRLCREARALGRIENKHIVEVVDLGFATNGAPFLVLELMAGRSLAASLRSEAPSVSEAIQWTLQVLHGLQSAHDAGIVHRDIRPENLFLEETLHRAVAIKILDFGLARVVSGREDVALRGPSGMTTKTGVLVGSPGYLSPEASRGERVDARSDLYSLAMVFYEMLTGLSPFDRYEAKLVPPSSLRKGLTPALDEVLLRAAHEDKFERYQNAGEFSRALEQCSLNIAAHPPNRKNTP